MLRVTTIRGVPLLVHWSVPALALFIAGVGVRNLPMTLSGIAAYVATIAIHELGHQVAAQSKRCKVLAVELYPLHGLCRHTLPASARDAALIAAAGPIAQLIVAVPLTLCARLFGMTPFAPVMIAIIILGPYSVAMALVNMLPIGRFDGRAVWAALPRPRRRPPPLKSAVEVFEEAVREARKR